MSARAQDPTRNLSGTLLAFGLAMVAGMSIAWLDKRTDEVIVAIVPLLVVGALLGLARPRHPWRWGLALGIWIPLAHWTGWFGEAKAPPNDDFSPLLALIPSTVAAYAGALIESLSMSEPEPRAPAVPASQKEA